MSDYYTLSFKSILMDRIPNFNNLFNEFEILGVEEFSIDEPEVDEILGERSYSGADLPESVLDEVDQVKHLDKAHFTKIYFSSLKKAQEFNDYLLIKHSITCELNSYQQQDWNSVWRESYQPINISPRHLLIPQWFDESKFDCDYIVKIYPGQGFGTGGHETTYLCLKLLVDDINLENVNSCLDFGCGSGILGIFLNQIKILSHTDYYDIDDSALENTKQNIEINNLVHDHRLLLPSSEDKFKDSYDIVFANILQDVLLNERNTISKLSRNYLVISGLLNGQEQDVLSAYDSFKTLKVLRKNDWCAILLQRL